MKLPLIALITLLLTSCGTQASPKFIPSIVGDGIADDTAGLQIYLRHCSTTESKCVIKKDQKIRITAPIYIWGKSSLVGEPGAEIHLDIADLTQRYVVNLGISGILQPEETFEGKIKGITFRVLSGPLDKWIDGRGTTPIAGRVIQCWKCKHAKIKNNVFEIGKYFYGSTASQVNGAYMFGLGVKHNITISNNTINQDSTSHGMECIGISNAQDITIKNNKCTGSGDDLIGVHFVDDIIIKENTLRGVDGRIYLASVTNAVVKDNHIERMPSSLDNLWYRGTALVYVGYENPARNHPRPDNILIKRNVLVLPEGSIDGGAVVNIRGAGNVKVIGNIIRNDSDTTPHGVWIAPWRDPSTPEPEYDLYYIEDISIINNKFSGLNPLQIIQTDQCNGYKGFVDILDNLGSIKRLSCPAVVNEHNNN